MEDKEIDELQEVIKGALESLNNGNEAYTAADLGSLYTNLETLKED